MDVHANFGIDFSDKPNNVNDFQINCFGLTIG